MRLKHIKNAEAIVNDSVYVIKHPEDFKGKWNQVFGNNNEIHIEIGTGKGKFITSLALDNKNINYIGIEKYDTPLVSAVKRLDELEVPNLRLICADAFNICDFFDKEVSKIYLNFSDPWPKNRHEKRRLTSPNFLNKYDLIFKDKKEIQLKTDNELLYEYSINSFEECGYEIVKNDTSYKDKYTTEYEDKFLSKNINIKYLYVVKK